MLGSEWLLFSLFRIAFFEKNEKEPKKKAKRTEKERNSVTTLLNRLSTVGEGRETTGRKGGRPREKADKIGKLRVKMSKKIAKKGTKSSRKKSRR